MRGTLASHRIGRAVLLLALLAAGPLPAAPPLVLPEALRWLGREPGPQHVAAAVRARGGTPELDTAIRRAAWAHALPTRLSFRIRRWEDDQLTDTLYDDGFRRMSDFQTRLGWSVDVVWDLSKLVLSPRGEALRRERREARRRTDQRVGEAIRLYYERRRLQLLFLTTRGPTVEGLATLWTRIEELTQRVDALAGGVLRRAKVRWWEPPGSSP